MDGEVAADELQALLDDGDVRVVDVRRRAAFERGHIPGSECIPLGELPQSVDRLSGADRVVTVCPHGEASVQAARLVASYEGLAEDATVESLACGVERWPGDLESSSDGPASSSDDERGARDEGPETDAPF